ncbi:MAG: purine-binding chemotaxis protein CheW [Candidatus Riflebacteria bacterium]|nr:purine-binding chemotaxis protein CheW [Candidatus Riflebacteria bacterium]
MEDEVHEDGQQTLIVTFLVGDSRYGLETSKVQEVVRATEITPVCHAPDEVIGVMNLRGRIVTILDLGKKIGSGAQEISSESRIFIVSMGQEYVGLLVDQVSDVVPLEEGALFPPPENVHKGHIHLLSGVFQSGEFLVAQLNLDEVLA